MIKTIKENSAEQYIEINTLSVLVPVYNSEKSIEPLVEEIIVTLEPHFNNIEIILVNDGSVDSSHDYVLQVQKNNPEIVKYLRLARNFGEHNAVMCGLNYTTGECVAIIDDDFQNPPSEILKIVGELQLGFDVVYSSYAKKRHSWFRNLGSKFNDMIATKLLIKPKDHYLSSFKAINRSLINSIIQYKGPYPYIDGIIFRSTNNISYYLCEHEDRKEGRSGYTLKKLIGLWLNMATGFSVLPLRMASILGAVISFSTILLIMFFVASSLMGGIFLKQDIPVGWTSLIIIVTFFAGIQLMVLGMIGEYLGRMYLTINSSPQYVVSESYGIESNEDVNA